MGKAFVWKWSHDEFAIIIIIKVYYESSYIEDVSAIAWSLSTVSRW